MNSYPKFEAIALAKSWSRRDPRHKIVKVADRRYDDEHIVTIVYDKLEDAKAQADSEGKRYWQIRNVIRISEPEGYIVLSYSESLLLFPEDYETRIVHVFNAKT
jgi:hypothetical protein